MLCIHLVIYYWASEASPTWAIHMGFSIYYYILSYVRRGLCDPLFFFLRRALCAVQSSCTVLFRCARPTHALHASSYYYYILSTYVGSRTALSLRWRRSARSHTKHKANRFGALRVVVGGALRVVDSALCA